MKRLALIFGLIFALAGSASAQQILTSSPVYNGLSAPPLAINVNQFSEFNVLLMANAPIVISAPVVKGSIPFRINTCQDSNGGWTPTFSATGGLIIVNRVGANLTTTTPGACDTEFWTYQAATGTLILQSVSLNTPPAPTGTGFPLTGNVSAAGFKIQNQGAGTGAGDGLVFNQPNAQLLNCLILNGSTSGGTSLCVAAIDGVTLFQLPTTNGTAGQVLTTDGTGITSWQNGGGGGGGSFPLTANVSAGGFKIQNQGVGTTMGDGIIFGLNHLNDLAPATGVYSMNGNKIQGLAAATVTNDAIAYGQAAAYLISATIDAANVNGVPSITAPPYNADPTGVANSQPAFQAAAAAICASSTATKMLIPPGLFSTDLPAYILCTANQNMAVEGSSEASSSIQPRGTFPGLTTVSNQYMTTLGPVAGTNLLTGQPGTHSMLWGTSASQYHYELNEIVTGPGTSGVQNILNGRSTLAFQFQVSIPATAGANNGGPFYEVSDTGVNFGGDDLLGGWTFGTPSTFQFCVRVSVTGRVCSPQYNITAGTHNLEWDLSGGKFYVFLDGVDQTSGGLTATGTTVENFDDLWWLGRYVGNSSYAFGGMDSFCVSSGAQNTSAFIPPTSKYTHSGSHCDLLLMNGQEVGTVSGAIGPFTQVDYANGATAPIYMLIRNDNGAAQGFGANTISHLNFLGGTDGLFSSLMPNARITNLLGTGSTYWNMEIVNNEYVSSYSNLSFTPSSSGSCFNFSGVSFGASSGNGILACNGGGAYRPQLSIDNGGGVLENVSLGASSTSTIGFRFSGAGSSTDKMDILGFNANSENGAPAYNGVVIDGARTTVNFFGGNISVTGASYCGILRSQNLNMTLNGLNCESSGGGAPTFAWHVDGGTFAQPVKWTNGQFNTSSLTKANASDDTGDNFDLSGATNILNGNTLIKSLSNFQIANEGATGTTLNHLAKITGAPSTAIILATTDTSTIGNVTSNAGITGKAWVQTSGPTPLTMDATSVVAGDCIGVSGSVAATGHDTGIPWSSTVGCPVNSIGMALETGAGSALRSVNLGFVSAPSIIANYGHVTNITNAASPYSVVASDYFIGCNATAGATTIILPAAAISGRQLIIKKMDSSANACTISRTGSDLIDGATTAVDAAQYQSFTFSDGPVAATWSIF